MLAILETKRWKDLDDYRLTKIRAEAYETWWSLSKADPKEPPFADARLDPKDFADGAATARLRAIAGYQALVKSHHADADIAARLKKLLAGTDTEQRDWYCFGD